MEQLNTLHKCLCGKTGIRLKSACSEVGACHCSICRKWSGGPYLGVKIDQGVVIEGQDNVVFYDSSDWAERAFCKLCGTHLFYRLKANGETHVPAGLLDGSEGLVLDHQIFIDQKPAYYNFSESTVNLTGAEVFAAFTPLRTTNSFTSQRLSNQ